MGRNKHIGLLCMLFFLFATSIAQNQIERSVIGTAGSDAATTNIKLTSTIGEPIINTVDNSPRVYTQGFQQPTRIVDLIFYDIVVEDASCEGIDNGFASIGNLDGCSAPYTILWSNGATGPDNRNLAPGNYSVQITSSDGCVTENYEFSIGTISNGPCILKFYTGITPNNDGINDQWIIDNIEAFPNNEITIFNRTGNEVWSASNYNNNTVVWGGENLSGNDSPSDTYFFVFESDGVTEKGWIELTR